MNREASQEAAHATGLGDLATVFFRHKKKALAFALGVVALYVPLLRAHPRAFLAGTVGWMVTLMLFAEHVLLPRLNPYQNFRAAAASVAELVPPGARLSSAEPRREVLFFYSGRRGGRVESAAELSAFLNGPAPAYCILPAEYWEAWRDGLTDISVRSLPSMAGEPFVLVTRAAK